MEDLDRLLKQFEQFLYNCRVQEHLTSASGGSAGGCGASVGLLAGGSFPELCSWESTYSLKESKSLFPLYWSPYNYQVVCRSVLM